MSNKKLERVIILCVAFAQALAEKYDAKPDLVEKVKYKLSTHELEKFESIAQNACSLLESHAFGKKIDERKALRAGFKAFNAMAKISSKAMSNQELSDLIPKGLKNKKDVALLKEMGAPKLASLCE